MERRMRSFLKWLIKPDGLWFLVLLLTLLLVSILCLYAGELLKDQKQVLWANAVHSLGVLFLATVWIQVLLRVWVWKQAENAIF